MLVDKKCTICNYIEEYCELNTKNKCPNCDIELKRVFGFRKPKEFIPGLYEHFDSKPIFIESKEQYRQECEKRGVVQTNGLGAYDSLYTKRKSHIEFDSKKSKKITPKQAAEKAIKDLGI